MVSIHAESCGLSGADAPGVAGPSILVAEGSADGEIVRAAGVVQPDRITMNKSAFRVFKSAGRRRVGRHAERSRASSEE